MKASLFAITALLALSGATAAVAAPACSGDYRWVDGGWIADPQCQHNVAEAIAAGENEKIVRNPTSDHEETRGQFCRDNDSNIAADGYCASDKY